MKWPVNCSVIVVASQMYTLLVAEPYLPELHFCSRQDPTLRSPDYIYS